MDDGQLSSLLWLVGALALHALVVLAYAALSNSREPLLREQVESGQDAPPRLHITYQISLILLQFLIAALAVLVVAQPLAHALNPQAPDEARTLAYLLTLLPGALLTLIVGDLVPAAIGSARADLLAPWLKLPMRLLILILSPLTRVIVAVSRLLAAAFGSGAMVNVFTEEEIKTLLDAGEKEGTIENEEKEMIFSVLQFGDTLAREVMIPRIDIVALDIETPLREALDTFISSGHSRIPVYEDNIDNIRGLLYAKDLLGLLQASDQPPQSIREVMRKAYFVPESKRCDVLFKDMQTSKIHMAIVVDEYGGTAGLVTIEDLIEEIVGDIQDEYDLNEEAEYIQKGPDEYLVDASINLGDFNELLDIELPTEDNDTLGGFIFMQIGRVPEVGETIEHEDLVMRVEAIDGRRIRKVHVVRRRPPALEDKTQVRPAALNSHQSETYPAPVGE